MTFTVSGTDGLTFPDSSTQAKSAANGQTGSAPFYSARAWVNFNGTGTVAIRASGNVTSITDNGTGDYTVNFTTAMPDANYSVQTSAGAGSGIHISTPFTTTPAAGSQRVATTTTGGTAIDLAYVTVSVFR